MEKENKQDAQEKQHLDFQFWGEDEEEDNKFMEAVLAETFKERWSSKEDDIWDSLL